MKTYRAMAWCEGRGVELYRGGDVAVAVEKMDVASSILKLVRVSGAVVLEELDDARKKEKFRTVVAEHYKNGELYSTQRF